MQSLGMIGNALRRLLLVTAVFAWEFEANAASVCRDLFSRHQTALEIGISELAELHLVSSERGSVDSAARTQFTFALRKLGDRFGIEKVRALLRARLKGPMKPGQKSIDEQRRRVKESKAFSGAKPPKLVYALEEIDELTYKNKRAKRRKSFFVAAVSEFTPSSVKFAGKFETRRTPEDPIRFKLLRHSDGSIKEVGIPVVGLSLENKRAVMASFLAASDNGSRIAFTIPAFEKNGARAGTDLYVFDLRARVLSQGVRMPETAGFSWSEDRSFDSSGDKFYLGFSRRGERLGVREEIVIRVEEDQ